MHVLKLAFKDIIQFSDKDKAYQINPEQFKDYLFDLPSLDGIHRKIQDRIKYPIDRILLNQVLNDQYSNQQCDHAVKQNVELLLESKTYTITTAHQPSLFTGPLYYILKILSSVRLCQVLKETFPDFNFVPIFVHGGEDHDFEEINHAQIFGKRIEWTNDQSGSCARMTIESLKESIEQLEQVLGKNEKAKFIIEALKNNFSSSASYGEFCSKFVNTLFGKFGLVQINMDSSRLKEAFADIIKKELTSRFSEVLVNRQIESLESF